MSKRGYEGTTMNAVDEAADVAVGGVYNYGDTKEALLLVVVGEACGDLVDAGEKVVVDPPSAPRVPQEEDS
jgi:AcrR family transcriptional regulator